jgi:hypothetical protein
MKKGTLAKNKRYSYNEVKDVTMYRKKEVSIDNEMDRSMDKENNIRYLRLN